MPIGHRHRAKAWEDDAAEKPGSQETPRSHYRIGLAKQASIGIRRAVSFGTALNMPFVDTCQPG
jgi:hypothetical protein